MASWHSPLFDWELIPLLRRRRYFAIRGVYAGLLLVILWSMFEVTMDEFRSQGGMRISNAATFANRFFVTFMFAQMTAILVATPSYVAATIAVHRERRNLDDLRTTDVSDFEIVVAKWAARSANVVLLILAGIPVLAILSFLGGVAFDRIACLTLISLATVGSTAAIAVRASSNARDIRSANWRAYGDLGRWLVGSLILSIPVWAIGSIVYFAFFITFFSNPVGGSDFAMLLFPYGAVAIIGVGYLEALELWIRTAAYCLLHGLFTVSMLGQAIVRLRDDVEGTPKMGVRPEEEDPFRVEPPMKPVGERPVFWREWNFGGGRRRGAWEPILVFGPLYIFYIIAIGIIVDGGERHGIDGVSAIGGLVAAVFVLLLVLNVATAFAIERERDMWDSLLATPLEVREIIFDKTIASWRTLRWLPVMMVPVWLAAIPVCGLSILALPCILFMALGHLTFAAGLSIWIGLRSATVAGAVASTLSALFVLEIVVPLLIMATWHWNRSDLPMMITPWVSWYVVHFAGGASLARILIALASGGVYGLAGIFLYRASIRRFDQLVGRTVPS